MNATKEQIIAQIKQRILDERRKHSKLDWAEIAARKIYATYFPDLDLLNDYSLFLEKQGYMDIDWRAEEPYAIDEFIKTLKK